MKNGCVVVVYSQGRQAWRALHTPGPPRPHLELLRHLEELLGLLELEAREELGRREKVGCLGVGAGGCRLCCLKTNGFESMLSSTSSTSIVLPVLFSRGLKHNRFQHTGGSA